MQRKIQIARLLLVVSFMFTIVFQFAHSFTHMTKATSYVLEHGTHDHFSEKTEITKNVFEWKEHHHSLEKCFQCEMIPHSAILPEVISFTTIDVMRVEKTQQVVIQQFTPLSHVYFSLRAPPTFV